MKKESLTLPRPISYPYKAIVKEQIEDSDQDFNETSPSQHCSIDLSNDLPSIKLKQASIPGVASLAPNFRQGSLNSCYKNVDLVQINNIFTTTWSDNKYTDTLQQRKQAKWM